MGGTKDGQGYWGEGVTTVTCTECNDETQMFNGPTGRGAHAPYALQSYAISIKYYFNFFLEVKKASC